MSHSLPGNISHLSPPGMVLRKVLHTGRTGLPIFSIYLYTLEKVIHKHKEPGDPPLKLLNYLVLVERSFPSCWRNRPVGGRKETEIDCLPGTARTIWESPFPASPNPALSEKLPKVEVHPVYGGCITTLHL